MIRGFLSIFALQILGWVELVIFINCLILYALFGHISIEGIPLIPMYMVESNKQIAGVKICPHTS